MKLTNAEIIKANTAENVSLKDRIQEAEGKVSGEEMKLHEAEQDAATLELLLQQIEATHEKKEEAEKKGKETSEKIAELAG